jgi:uncharacterized protein (TIGR01777 family)
VDAVVNLAGAPIADRPWTHRRKALLWSSRITLTETLLAWLEGRQQKPAVLISGSAVGWYGDGGERELTEESPPVNEDFASQLCIAWEETAQRAEALGCAWCWYEPGWCCQPRAAFCRGCCCRSSLGWAGLWQWSAVDAMDHIDDQIALIDFLLHRNEASGPYNACAPKPVRNREFAKTLGSVLHRPAFMPMPALALKVGLGRVVIAVAGRPARHAGTLAGSGFHFPVHGFARGPGRSVRPPLK